MSNVVISSIRSSSSTAVDGKRLSAELQPARRWLRTSYFAAITDFWTLVGLGWALLQLHVIPQHLPEKHLFTALPLLVFAILPINAALGLYSRLRLSVSAVLFKSAAGVFIVLALGAVSSLISPGSWFLASGIVLVAFLPISLLMRWALATCIRWRLARPHNVQRVVIVGHDPRLCIDLAGKVKAYEDRCNRIVAFFGIAETDINEAKDNVPRFVNTDGLIEYLTHNPADVVLFAADLGAIRGVETTIASILELGLTVGVLPPFHSADLVGQRSQVIVSTGYSGLSIVQLQSVRQGACYLFFKRVFDIVGAGSALLLLSPVFLAIVVLLKVTSKGPIFYPWKVLGKNRRPFVGYKFRTMVPDADKIKKQLMQFNEMTGPVFKMRNDPRITPVGRWLRKFSLDELPQLYSVLKGDMSFVGPRPPSKAESDRFDFWQHRKLSVKPGITCLWQVSGRSEISDFSEWARLDLQYIATASFALDMKILLRTVPVVLIGHGAY